MQIKLLLILMLTLLSIVFTFGQNTNKFPTLQQLETYCKIKSNAEFSKISKSFGFSFEVKNPQSYGMDYVYIRQTTKNGVIITDRFIYEYFSKDQTVLIQAVTTQTDFSELYKTRIDKAYSLSTCSGSTESNELEICYSNKYYLLSISSIRKTFSNGTTGNVSQIMIKSR